MVSPTCRCSWHAKEQRGDRNMGKPMTAPYHVATASAPTPCLICLTYPDHPF